MKAVQLIANKKFKFIEKDIIEPTLNQCLLKVNYVSVCGTDTRREFDKNLPVENYPMPPGMPCHEVVGTIFKSNSLLFKEGDRVLAVPTGDDGLQEYLTLDESRFIMLPDKGGLDDWVMCQHSGTALYASKQWGNPSGKTITVIGQGGIGISFTMIANMQGAAKVIAVDINQSRLDISRSLGATYTINNAESNLSQMLLDVNEGKFSDIVVEATGRPDGLNNCISIVKKGGIVICFGLTSEDYVPFNQNAFLSKNCQIISTLIAGTETPLKEIKEMINLKKRGLINPSLLKTHIMHWSKVQEAYDLYNSTSEGMVKIALEVS
jgi:L-iditol 2-dehydrogenase